MIQGSVGIVAGRRALYREHIDRWVAVLPGETLYDIPFGFMVSITFQIYR